MDFDMDDRTLAQLVRIATRVAYGVYTLVLLGIVAAFGVGVFFARTDSRLSIIEEKLNQLGARIRRIGSA